MFSSKSLPENYSFNVHSRSYCGTGRFALEAGRLQSDTQSMKPSVLLVENGPTQQKRPAANESEAVIGGLQETGRRAVGAMQTKRSGLGLKEGVREARVNLGGALLSKQGSLSPRFSLLRPAVLPDLMAECAGVQLADGTLSARVEPLHLITF